MRRNDKGIAVPGESPTPYGYDDDSWFLVDANGLPLTDEDGCYFCKDTEKFVAHAANYHERLAEIVRQLAIYARETSEPNHPSPTYKLTDIKDDALRLWIDMRKDGVDGPVEMMPLVSREQILKHADAEDEIQGGLTAGYQPALRAEELPIGTVMVLGGCEYKLMELSDGFMYFAHKPTGGWTRLWAKEIQELIDRGVRFEIPKGGS